MSNLWNIAFFASQSSVEFTVSLDRKTNSLSVSLFLFLPYQNEIIINPYHAHFHRLVESRRYAMLSTNVHAKSTTGEEARWKYRLNLKIDEFKSRSYVQNPCRTKIPTHSKKLSENTHLNSSNFSKPLIWTILGLLFRTQYPLISRIPTLGSNSWVFVNSVPK